MKKHDVTSGMPPDAVEKYKANMDMIEKVKSLNVSKHGYNLSQRDAFSQDSISPPKTGLLGIIARND